MEKRQLSPFEQELIRRVLDDPSRLDALLKHPKLREYWHELLECYCTHLVELMQGAARVAIVGPIVVRRPRDGRETARAVGDCPEDGRSAPAARRPSQAALTFQAVLDVEASSVRRAG